MNQRVRITLLTPMEMKSSNKSNMATSMIANTVELGLLALLFIAIASAPVLFSIGHVIAQSGNTGSQRPTLPPPAQQFPPVFPPGDNAKFLRLQVVQKSWSEALISVMELVLSVALCHADEQVVGGGFVERRSAPTSPGQSSTQSTIDFRVLASFRAQPPTNGWTVRAFGSNTSFAPLAQCAKIVIQ